MDDAQSLHLVFDGGSRERGPATCVAPNVYRLGWSPFAAVFEEIELFFGDVIQVERMTDGSDGFAGAGGILRIERAAEPRYRFVGVVERGPFVHHGFVVGPAFLASTYFETFAAALRSAGGLWEVPFNGWLVVHLPTGSPFDVAGELLRQREQAVQAGVVDRPEFKL